MNTVDWFDSCKMPDHDNLRANPQQKECQKKNDKNHDGYYCAICSSEQIKIEEEKNDRKRN